MDLRDHVFLMAFALFQFLSSDLGNIIALTFWKLIEKTLSMMFLFLHLLHVPPLLGARRTL